MPKPKEKTLVNNTINKRKNDCLMFIKTKIGKITDIRDVMLIGIIVLQINCNNGKPRMYRTINKRAINITALITIDTSIAE